MVAVKKPQQTKRRKRVKNYKKKSIDLAKYIVRKKVNACEWCGKKNVKFDGAHIIPVRYSAVAADLDNILCLCSRCHTLGSDSCHDNPVLFTRWLDSYAPGRYENLWIRAREIGDNIDWEQKYNELKKLRDELNL